ncbi:carboxypeptidase-like regulatory domain-containing protein [Flavobacterium sp. I-SCBP12n]|uniref:Carboxypeptidase-like regulatory domain-containing protein n=1 Tax=Flavobacterium pygoscelis TaxID=2893176 RepID=A0A9X1XX35_9FLAO|nr:carboxypeptidase-like regulatory domain-containing protein [Flavobacterium pygoscelis]MCK8143401.1 carboxypeptidase-like regulatory domain-containing protein [Flavobacterium pygoscelis]
MKKQFLFTLLAVFNIYFSYSQNTKILVLDSISNLPIKYANVNFLNGFGVFSNEKGNIMISDLNINSIEISHVSYESKKIDLNKINNSIVLLKPKIIKLDEIVIKKEKLKLLKTISLKPKIHSNYKEMFFSAIGLKLAFKINSSGNKINFLKSIEIPLFKKTNDATKDFYPEKKYPYKTLIKVEILKSIDDKPGEKLYDYNKYEIINSELLNDSFISTFEKNIKIPENGLFVVLTFIGKVDENNLLITEMPYDINKKFPDRKFIKWILPNIPITASDKNSNTFFRFDYGTESNWKQIEKPINYDNNKEYPIFDIGIGYKIDLME